jgi:hypothetical protein
VPWLSLEVALAGFVLMEAASCTGWFSKVDFAIGRSKASIRFLSVYFRSVATG